MIDPRSFPLKEVLCFIRRSSPNHGVNKHTSIFNVLNKLISKHCPDVIHHVNNIRLLSSDSSTISGIKITPSALSQSIRDCISDGTSDSSGIRAEQMYHMARSCNPIDTLVATVCSAVLSPKHSQPKYFSYVHLCKDPLGEMGVKRLLCHIFALSLSLPGPRTNQSSSRHQHQHGSAMESGV